MSFCSIKDNLFSLPYLLLSLFCPVAFPVLLRFADFQYINIFKILKKPTNDPSLHRLPPERTLLVRAGCALTQPDTLVLNLLATQVLGWYAPQSLNRYAYVLNNPVRYNDPSGHMCSDPEDPTPTCDGSGTTRVGDRMIGGEHVGGGQTYAPSPLPVEPTTTISDVVTYAFTGWIGIDDFFNAYHTSWQNFGTAWSIYWNPDASYLDRWITGTYIGLWGSAHAALALSVAGLACAATGPGCVAAAEGLMGIGAVVSADGDPTNEIVVLGRFPDYLQAAKEIGGKTFNVPTATWNALSKAEQWALNQQFLNNAITNGNTFYLASKWSEAVTGSFFRMELEYLFSQGYTLSLYQNYLIPPITNLP
jgi:hypothetical protein